MRNCRNEGVAGLEDVPGIVHMDTWLWKADCVCGPTVFPRFGLLVLALSTSDGRRFNSYRGEPGASAVAAGTASELQSRHRVSHCVDSEKVSKKQN